MMKLKIRPDESIAEFLIRKRGLASHVLKKSTGSLSAMLLHRFWSYFGHCCRNTSIPIIPALMSWRSHSWWELERARPTNWRIMHRQSGQQIAHQEDMIIRYCRANGVDLDAVIWRRDEWRILAAGF
eukprot:9061419-Karenia_brevis.AAC.1